MDWRTSKDFNHAQYLSLFFGSPPARSASLWARYQGSGVPLCHILCDGFAQYEPITAKFRSLQFALSDKEPGVLYGVPQRLSGLRDGNELILVHHRHQIVYSLEKKLSRP